MDTTTICGLVILYHPSEKEIENIRLFATNLKKFWIIDNSEYDLHDYNTYFAGIGNIAIIQDGHNLGIGARINEVLKKADEEGFKWVLTMDQDSTFTTAELKRYLFEISAVEDRENVAMIGVNHANERRALNTEIFFRNVNSVITSGTAVNIEVAKKIGLLNEDLFIDEVDTEFSYRAIINGWRILLCEGIYMKHTLGERQQVHSLATFKKTERSIYSPVRLYYMTRNFLWVRKQYRRYLPDVFQKRSKQLINLYKNNILYAPHKLKMLRMIMKGYNDYKNGKLGRI